jgi:hypothetical protein
MISVRYLREQKQAPLAVSGSAQATVRYAGPPTQSGELLIAKTLPWKRTQDFRINGDLMKDSGVILTLLPGLRRRLFPTLEMTLE